MGVQWKKRIKACEYEMIDFNQKLAVAFGMIVAAVAAAASADGGVVVAP